MRSAIEEKLRLQLQSKDPLTEARVVYILVQIRKLLDMRDESDEKYSTLRFYCNWALHIGLTNKTAQNLLRLFDEAHPLIRAGELPQDLRRQIEEIIHLRRFEKDFDHFLTEYNLSRGILDEPWTTFLRSYARVVQDSPLIVTAEGLRSVKTVTVTIEDALRPIKHESGESLMFRIRWTCCGNDGTQGVYDSYNSVEIAHTSE